MTSSNFTNSNILFASSGLLTSSSTDTSIAFACIYFFISFLVLVIFNKCWCGSDDRKEEYGHLNDPVSKETLARKENNAQLKQLVKLGQTPSRQAYIDHSPTSKAANAILTNEQKSLVLKAESNKGRRVSR